MQKKFIILLGIVIVLVVVFIFVFFDNEVPADGDPRLPISGDFMSNDLEEIGVPVVEIGDPIASTSSTSTPEEIKSTKEDDDEEMSNETITELVAETVVENLTIPWGLAFLPNGNLLISERSGGLVEFNVTTGGSVSIDLENVRHAGEGGLLGIALHPDFEANRYVYVYQTSSLGGKSQNSVLRYVYQDQKLSDAFIIIDNIPGAFFHNGGRIVFGPDGHLYIATGDAQDPELSQDLDSLAGKILRLTAEGRIPEDNPFKSEVYSYGHRNPQGITWDSAGALWITEHGRSGARSGLDELNLIIPGGNYGWPRSQGDLVLPDTIGPVIHSGPDVTWAPGSAVYVDGSIFFGGLRGKTLYEAVLTGLAVTELKTHFVNEFGRIRTVELGPDGHVYMTTSNRDGRGSVADGDDRIIRVKLPNGN